MSLNPSIQLNFLHRQLRNRVPIQKGGPQTFLQCPAFLGDKGLTKVNSNLQPPKDLSNALPKI